MSTWDYDADEHDEELNGLALILGVLIGGAFEVGVLLLLRHLL